jgi:hypothetical protein
VLAAAREGFLPYFEYGFNFCNSYANTNWDTKSSGTRSTPAHAGARRCEIVVTGASGQIADALRRRLEDADWVSQDLRVTVESDASDAYQFLPLFKYSTRRVHLVMKADWRGPESGGEATVTTDGVIELTVWGVCSRRHFNELVAERVADKVVETVNAEIVKR